MNREEILEILKHYVIASFEEAKEIDSTNGDDYRLNIIIDKKYVLRINNPVITESRLASVDRLAERYRAVGVLAPRLLRNDGGNYLLPYGDHVCYVSEYLDYPLLSDERANFGEVQKEVLRSIGRLSARYTNVDLMDTNSMWSVIDLAPLDVDIDEKQENLNTLAAELKKYGEDALAEEVVTFNEFNRAQLRKIYKKLPRCVIQGDLNDTNILVDNGHFVGVIDFNMAGTEVNINHFCCETNEGFTLDDFKEKDPETLFREMARASRANLEIILSEYRLNEDERAACVFYRNICNISQFPNVMDYINFLSVDKEKAVELIRWVIRGEEAVCAGGEQ